MNIEDIDVNNVLEWNGRPKRQRKKPVTYWEEFVATDEWYTNELVVDVPEDEMFAACEDDDFEGDECEITDGLDFIDSESDGDFLEPNCSSDEESDGGDTSESRESDGGDG